MYTVQYIWYIIARAHRAAAPALALAPALDLILMFDMRLKNNNTPVYLFL
jgi:hypothetical protein